MSQIIFKTCFIHFKKLQNFIFLFTFNNISFENFLLIYPIRKDRTTNFKYLQRSSDSEIREKKDIAKYAREYEYEYEIIPYALHTYRI